VDATLGAKFPVQGSTAVCAVVERAADKATACLSWVGDSKLVEVDVLSSSRKADPFESWPHHVDNPREVARIEAQARLRAHHPELRAVADRAASVEAFEESPEFKQALHDVLSQIRGPSSPMALATSCKRHLRVSFGSAAADPAVDDDGDALPLEKTLCNALARSLDYESRVSAFFDDDADNTNDDASTKKKEESREHKPRRAQSKITRREMQSGAKGPVVVQTRWLTSSPDVTRGSSTHVTRGSSTRVTRSIGDWDSSRTLIPHPEVVLREVTGAAVWRRFVLASDGFWDVASAKAVRDVASKFAGTQDAADALIKLAHRKYAKQNVTPNPFTDDTTILVFDLKLGDPQLPSSRARRSPWLCFSNAATAVRS